jgi:hypothetical protein
MDTEFLSTGSVPATSGKVPGVEGSVNYTDPATSAALGQEGLKERATCGGQIVTALKMVWCWFLAPFQALMWGLKKVFFPFILAFRLLRRMVRVARQALRATKEWILDTGMILKAATNRRMRAFIVAVLVYLTVMLGMFGLVVGVVGLFCWVMCYVPADARYYIRLFESLSRAWEDALDAKELSEDLKFEPVKAKKRSKFACKLAIRAISRVGMLSPTKANALVYQKVLLDDMQSLHVRMSDRVRVLPLAIAACLDRPEEVQKVERCIQHLCTLSGNH